MRLWCDGMYVCLYVYVLPCRAVCSKLRYLTLEMFGDLESYMYGSFEFYMALTVSS